MVSGPKPEHPIKLILGRLLASKILPIYTFGCNGQWGEIDDLDDLNLYHRMLQQGDLKLEDAFSISGQVRAGPRRDSGGFATNKDVLIGEQPGKESQADRMQGLEPRPQAIARNPCRVFIAVPL